MLDESGFDALVRTPDGAIHRLRREGEAFRRAQTEPSRDWPTYHGNYEANRYSDLDQIHLGNVGKLRAEGIDTPVYGLGEVHHLG